MYAPSKLSPPETPTKRRRVLNFVARDTNTVRCLHRQRHGHVRRVQTHAVVAGQQLEGDGPLRNRERYASEGTSNATGFGGLRSTVFGPDGPGEPDVAAGY